MNDTITRKSTKAAKVMLARKGYITRHELCSRLKLGFFRSTAILEKLTEDNYLHPADTGPLYKSTGKAEEEAAIRKRRAPALANTDSGTTSR